MSLHKLENVIQNYAWGSRSAIGEMFGISNPTNEPQAEIWMGAHPNGCSKLADSGQLLSDYIGQNRTKTLGAYTAARFGELPYLFKVLSAETPLSIQVHPSKRKSELGYAREHLDGTEINQATLNYKDPNHKPELIYALTFYKAMNGFRPIAQIVCLFKEAQIHTLDEEISKLEFQPTSDALRAFFTTIMSLEGERKQQALNELYAACERPAKTALGREALSYSDDFRAHYMDDIGLFAPLMLNTIELAPGEAMFLQAETPHAYVQGTGLEIMANSDNVLRAGLTPKHIDVPELIDNTRFCSIDPASIKLKPIFKDNKLSFPVPVDDFGFDIVTSTGEAACQYVRSAEIVFCIEGEVTVCVNAQEITLKRGESAFIAHDSVAYQYTGIGRFARAYN